MEETGGLFRNGGWTKACESAACVEVKYISAPCDTGNCVEVGIHAGEVHVRDSKNPDGPVLKFTVKEWKNFLFGAGDGIFDPEKLAN